MAELNKELSKNFAGPIIFEYVWWVLYEARARKLNRLYFLARDGYILMKVAKMFCREFGINIDCRYLTCSRTSLRLPCYCQIGNEAYDLLLIGNYYTTLSSLLQRLPLDEKQMREIYTECGLENIDAEKVLTKQEFKDICSKIRLSKVFAHYMKEISESEYRNAIEFFRQEGLFDKENIAIVDSGWTGSMQRTLRQLLQSAGFTGTITGFYFGLYSAQQKEDGTYLTWYFDKTGRTCDKVYFNNNLFEILLSAPHGMALVYRKQDNRYVPILTDPPSEKGISIINDQIERILSYTAERLLKTNFESFSKEKYKLKRDTQKRIKRYMVYPRQAEAEFYGNILFCDDISEQYYLKIAARDQISAIKGYLLLPRVLSRIKKRGRIALLWPYGVISFLPKWKQPWYRLNVDIWGWVKYSLSEVKYQSEQAMFARYTRLIDKCDVVSFDVFDTLLYRVVHKPTEVFHLMEPEMEKRYQIQNYCEKRIQAEQLARKLSDEEDITIQEIYDVMGIRGWDKNAAICLEKNTEFSVLVCDRFMYKVFRYCIESGKQTVIISDMYQPQDFIAEALRRNSIDGYNALYVSSAVKKTKASGSLFQYVLERERISNKKRWLHIGDNRRSDYLIPRQLGLRAQLYQRRET